MLHKLLPLIFVVVLAVEWQCDVYGPPALECSKGYNQRALAQTLHGPMPTNGRGMESWTNEVNNTYFLLNVAEKAPR